MEARVRGRPAKEAVDVGRQSTFGKVGRTSWRLEHRLRRIHREGGLCRSHRDVDPRLLVRFQVQLVMRRPRRLQRLNSSGVVVLDKCSKFVQLLQQMQLRRERGPYGLERRAHRLFEFRELTVVPVEVVLVLKRDLRVVLYVFIQSFDLVV